VLFCSCSRTDPHHKGVLEYSRIRVQGLCVVVRCTYVQWHGRTYIHARTTHHVFMRCRLDIMVLCILTSCATAGMLYHKFNYRLIETTQTYFKRHWTFGYTECSTVKLCTVFGISQHRGIETKFLPFFSKSNIPSQNLMQPRRQLDTCTRPFRRLFNIDFASESFNCRVEIEY
jgi:hypothetical protein